MKLFLKGAAMALGLAAAAAGAPAAATNIVHLNSLSMDGTYWASINYDDATNHIHETAYSNGVTFNLTNIDGVNAGVKEDVFAFCIDIFHNISLGALDDYYVSTYGDEPNPQLHDGSGATLSGATLHAVTSLADIGYLLHRDHVGMTVAEASLHTAAIQAAIWEVEHPGAISLWNPTATVNGTDTYQSLFNYYRTLNGPGARVFTLTDTSYGGDHERNHQGFVVGWPPSGTPEPATWALMVGGFLGAGAALRRRKSAAA